MDSISDADCVYDPEVVPLDHHMRLASNHSRYNNLNYIMFLSLNNK